MSKLAYARTSTNSRRPILLSICGIPIKAITKRQYIKNNKIPSKPSELIASHFLYNPKIAPRPLIQFRKRTSKAIGVLGSYRA